MSDNAPTFDGAAGKRLRRGLAVGAVVAIVIVFTNLGPSRNACTSWWGSSFDHAISLDLNGDKQAAISAYTDDLRSNPNHVEALKYRADNYVKLGRFDDATADLTRVLQLYPNDADALRRRADVYVHQSRFDEAIADLTRAAQAGADLSEIGRARGDARLAKGDLDGAIADYSSAIERDQRAVANLARYPRGVAYLRAGRFDLAEADFAAVLASSPNSAAAEKGRSCASQGSNSGACALVYPEAPNPTLDRIFAAAGKAVSGCQ